MLKVRRGQSVLEYAILMVIVIAALLTLQTYIKRGISGRLKSATDDIGDQFTTANGYTYNKTIITNSKVTENSLAGVTTTITNYSNTTTNATSSGMQNAVETWH